MYISNGRNYCKAAQKEDNEEFVAETKLANPTLELQFELEKFMYAVGRHILTAYNEFEG